MGAKIRIRRIKKRDTRQRIDGISKNEHTDAADFPLGRKSPHTVALLNQAAIRAQIQESPHPSLISPLGKTPRGRS